MDLQITLRTNAIGSTKALIQCPSTGEIIYERSFYRDEDTATILRYTNRAVLDHLDNQADRDQVA